MSSSRNSQQPHPPSQQSVPIVGTAPIQRQSSSSVKSPEPGRKDGSIFLVLDPCNERACKQQSTFSTSLSVKYKIKKLHVPRSKIFKSPRKELSCMKSESNINHMVICFVQTSRINWMNSYQVETLCEETCCLEMLCHRVQKDGEDNHLAGR